MGCLECGDLDNIKWLHRLCNKCEAKYEKLGKKKRHKEDENNG